MTKNKNRGIIYKLEAESTKQNNKMKFFQKTLKKVLDKKSILLYNKQARNNEPHSFKTSKTFSKNFEKVLDKNEKVLYNKQAFVARQKQRYIEKITAQQVRIEAD